MENSSDSTCGGNEVSKLMNRYKLLSQAMKAGIWFTICNILQRGIQFITTPIFTRILTTEQYGFYSLFMTWMNILSVFATLNVTGGIYYNGLLKFEDDKIKYTSALQGLCTACTIIVFIIISLMFPLLKIVISIPYLFVFLMFVLFITQPALGFWSAQERMNYRYRMVLTVTLFNSLSAPLLGILFISYTHMKGEGVILGYVIANVLVSTFFYVNNLCKCHALFAFRYWKYTLALSVPLIPHYLSQILLGQSDRIMINYYCGASKAGIYTLAYQVALMMNILINGINSAYTPWMYKKLKCSKNEDIKKFSSLLVYLFLLISMLVVLLAPEIITLLGTKDYLQAIWIIPPVMLSTFVTFIYCSFGTILFYYEETKDVSIASLAGAASNILMNLFFIPRYGFIAAGYTTFISYLFMMIIYYIFMKKCCLKNGVYYIPFDIKKISIMVFGLICYSALAIWLYNNYFLRYIVAILVIFVIWRNYQSLKTFFSK